MLHSQQHRPLRVQLAILLFGMALVAPSLGAGFFADDYVQIAQLEGWSLNPAGPLDLYSFVPRDTALVERLRQEGVLPYFAAPELKIAFLRPLSSGLMWLDHSLFGRWAVPYHVHTLAWWAALLMVTAALLRRVLPAGLATLALLLFCLDDGHAMSAGWIAARHATVSCVFVLLGFLAHHRWRTCGWRPGAMLAPLAMALGLAAGEVAMGAVTYLVAWELTERRPHRALALAPTLVLTIVYLAVHRYTGSGARASGAYLDPFGDPLGFAAALPERALLLLSNLVAGAPIDLLLLDERLRVPLLALGGGVALVLALWLPLALRKMPADEAAAVRWLGLGAAGALLASTPALLGERVLLAASLGGAVVVAALLRDAWRRVREGRTRVGAALGLLALGAPNVAAAAVALPAKTILLGKMSHQIGQLAREAEVEAPIPARVVVLALDDLLAIHLPMLRIFEQGWPAQDLPRMMTERTQGTLPLPDRLGYLGSTVLSLSSRPHRVRRTAADTFELFTPAGTLLDGTWAEAVRAPSIALGKGSVVRLPFMTATVREDREGRPARVEFRFERPLEDPSLVFLVLDRRRLRRFAWPAVGQQADLPRGHPLVERE